MSIVAKPIIVELGSNMLILIFCAFPAFICGLFLSKIIESPRFVYGKSKIKALNMLNSIDQKNNK
jgi:hypothetical protein